MSKQPRILLAIIKKTCSTSLLVGLPLLLFGFSFFTSALPLYAETINLGTAPSTDVDWLGRSANQKYSQTFTPSVNATAVQVSAYIENHNSPTDSVQVDIYSSSGGDPTGSSLGSATIAHGSLANNCTTINNFPTITTTLTAGVTYTVVYSRTGALDSTNAYWVCVLDSTTIRVYNGSWGNYPNGYIVTTLTTTPAGGGGTVIIATSSPETVAIDGLTFGMACIFFVLCLFGFAYFTAGYTK